jgi:hypothetical protein
MEYENIKVLYKYLDWNDRARSILEDEIIWYSKVSEFNDPFEGIYEINYDITPESIVSLAVKGLSNEYHNWSSISDFILKNVVTDDFGGLRIREDFRGTMKNRVEEMLAGLKNAGVLSLSESHRNILLWSHYANDHKGICIEFERDIDDFLGNSSFCRPVIYSEIYPIPSIDDVLKHEDFLTNQILFTKSKHWEYEKEWRIWNTAGNKTHPIPGKILSVTMGAKWDGDVNLLKRLSMQKDFKLFKASTVKGKYGLNIRKFI